MPESSLSLVIWFFIAYSFAGWLWEFLFNLVAYRRFHWRGFMTLPLLPIYGVSALAVLYVVRPLAHDPFVIFFGSVVAVTVIEFVTGFFLKKLFRVRLWDYTDWPLNIHGYVSVPSSVGFGALALLLLYEVHPFLALLIGTVPVSVLVIGAVIMSIIFVLDYINSLAGLIHLRVDIAKIQGSIDEIRRGIDGKVDSLATQRKRVRATVYRWYRHNVRQTVKAFPSIRTYPKRTSRSPKSR